jgi:hypothetical protein
MKKEESKEPKKHERGEKHYKSKPVQKKKK